MKSKDQLKAMMAKLQTNKAKPKASVSDKLGKLAKARKKKKGPNNVPFQSPDKAVVNP